jgi:hypothetical protein
VAELGRMGTFDYPYYVFSFGYIQGFWYFLAVLRWLWPSSSAIVSPRIQKYVTSDAPLQDRSLRKGACSSAVGKPNKLTEGVSC